MNYYNPERVLTYLDWIELDTITSFDEVEDEDEIEDEDVNRNTNRAF